MEKKGIVELVNESYDPIMFVEQKPRVFGGQKLDFDKIGFFNYGYWKGVDDSVELAQINLIETLVRFLSNKDGNVLDVACGKGASSKFLSKYFDPKNITGINISERQLQVCRLIAPECNFKLMDATKLDLLDSSVDNVLCIEAAFHFMTRYRFFEEAYRVLKPGGRLAMSDIVVHDHDLLPPDMHKESWPRENCLPNLDAYRENLLKVGFKYVRVEDSTEFSVDALIKFRIRKAEREFDSKRDYRILDYLMNAQSHDSPWRRAWTWCMAYAIK